MGIEFAGDLELSRITRPLRDIIYKKYLHAVKTEWDKNRDQDQKGSEGSILDRLYHIDCTVTTDKGYVLTLQEKGLRYKFSNFNTFTMEYYQHRDTKQPGEYFTLASQLYFHGYLTDNLSAFEKWMIVDIPRFMIWSREYDLTKRLRADTVSHANFVYFDYDMIPNDVIIAKFNTSREEQLSMLLGPSAMKEEEVDF
jgi:hypothetical protein